MINYQSGTFAEVCTYIRPAKALQATIRRRRKEALPQLDYTSTTVIEVRRDFLMIVYGFNNYIESYMDTQAIIVTVNIMSQHTSPSRL